MPLVACDSGSTPVEPERAASVSIAAPETTVRSGASLQLKAVALDAAGRPLTDRAVSWSSSAENVATIDSAGMVTGKRAGAAVITARVEGVSDTLSIRVVPGTAVSIRISPDTVVILEGWTRALQTSVFDQAGNTISDRRFVWSSSAAEVASVVQESADRGLVTAWRPGTAILRAELDSLWDTVTVTVRRQRLYVTPDTVAMVPGITRSLTAFELRTDPMSPVAGVGWSSSDPGVAQVTPGGRVTAMRAGRATITVTADERVATTEVFVRMYERPLRFSAVSAAGDHTCGLTDQGEAYCWGRNDLGPRLGTAELMDRCGKTMRPPQHRYAPFWLEWTTYRCSAIPIRVQGGIRFTAISASDTHTCGVTDEGEAYCWGENWRGALGNGTTEASVRPVRVSGNIRFRSIRAGTHYTCGVTPENRAYCWGYNSYGSLGVGTTSSTTVPTLVAEDLEFRSVEPSDYHTCGITTGGVVYCWGINLEGQLGIGEGGSSKTPARVVTSVRFKKVELGFGFTCGLAEDGKAYCWGRGRRLGRGSEESSKTPVAVAGGRTFADLSTGSWETCALDAAGALYCWGDSIKEGLRLAPTLIYPGFTFRSIGIGSSHGCGLSREGVAYCWGFHDTRLGSGDAVHTSSGPVRVAGQAGG